ncbi:MAG: hypothetical protein ACFFDB_15185 [Promethearchaeota archaeon]
MLTKPKPKPLRRNEGVLWCFLSYFWDHTIEGKVNSASDFNENSFENN